MNQQPIEKRNLRDDGLIDVHSIFHTIQGEGPFCGTPAVFIRLAGCNLQCPACDTEYTQGRQIVSAEGIAQEVLGLTTFSRTKLVVITGGEPFRQNLAPLFEALLKFNFYIQVETNGTLAPTAIDYNLLTDQRSGVYIVCSPKTGKIHPAIMQQACALKYVLEHDSIHADDGLPIRALQHSAFPYVARPHPNFRSWGRHVYVQPMDAHDPVRNQRNMDAAVRSCLEHGYILQLQIHKLIGVE